MLCLHLTMVIWKWSAGFLQYVKWWESFSIAGHCCLLLWRSVSRRHSKLFPMEAWYLILLDKTWNESSNQLKITSGFSHQFRGSLFCSGVVWCREPPTKVIEFILGSQHQLRCQGSLVGNDDPFILPHILLLLLNWIAIWIVLKRACLTWMMVMFFLTLMPFVPLVMKADTDTAYCRCRCDSCRCNLSHSVYSKQSYLASIYFVLYLKLQVFSLNGRSQGGVRDILNQSALRSLCPFLCLWY